MRWAGLPFTAGIVVVAHCAVALPAPPHGLAAARNIPLAMLLSTAPSAFDVWSLITRLGEAQILLPAALVGALALLRHGHGRRLAAWWLALLAAAVTLTTASKLAFIGWGIGWPELDFTGISGHAMFAAAIYPLLLGTLAPPRRQANQWLGVAAGVALALLIGVSRVVVQAHSASEVVAGLLLGFAVSAIALGRVRPPHARTGLWVAPLAALWLALTPAVAPRSQSHEMVTRLALTLSGRDHPYTRDAMWRELRARRVL